MTRIRRNWTSSRGAEELDPPSALVLNSQSVKMDTSKHRVSPYELDHVDKDTMLAAVSLTSLEFDNNAHKNKHETVSARLWDRAVIVGAGLSKQARFEMCSRKFLGDLGSDCEPDVLPNGAVPVRKDTVDDQAKASDPKILNHKRESDSMRELDQLAPGAEEPKDARRLLPVGPLGREKENDDTARVHPALFEGKIISRKKRRKLSDSESDLCATGVHSTCNRTVSKPQETSIPTGSKTTVKWNNDRPGMKLSNVSKTPATGISAGSENIAKDSNDRSRMKVSSVSKTQETGMSAGSENIVKGNKNRSRMKLSKVTQDHATDSRIDNVAKSEDESVHEKYSGDRIVRGKMEVEKIYVDDMNTQKKKAGKENFLSSGNDLATKSEKVETLVGDQDRQRSGSVGSDAGDRNRGKAKVIEIDADLKNDHSVKSVTLKRRACRQGTSTLKDYLWLDDNHPSSAKGGGSSVADMFPAGWSYRGLAQIAEKDKTTHGQGKQQCGRTDGRDWRCPLKVQEGFTLCEHHLNKSRLKKMGKNRKGILKGNLQKSDQPIVSPQTSDSAVKPPAPLDCDTDCGTDVPTKVRRKLKTVKLSGL